MWCRWPRPHLLYAERRQRGRCVPLGPNNHSTPDYVAKAVCERVELRFPREKLSTRTDAKVRCELVDVLRRLAARKNVEEVAANTDDIICERDLQDANRLNARIHADIVNGPHGFAGVIDLLL